MAHGLFFDSGKEAVDAEAFGSIVAQAGPARF